MMYRTLVGLSLLATAGCAGVGGTRGRTGPPPPPVQQEFRAAWIATVANIDWPSEKGLRSGEQQAELRALLDRAVALNLNAVILQVRPAADALYVSSLEPWSEYLTGDMGKAPFPFYDPLEFAVEEAHRRGLEIHAWFNPFRAHHPTGSSPISENHISVLQPDLVVEYGAYMWLDPGDWRARQHSIEVIMDVVRRYDIDGVHMDDYFYPYEISDSLGQTISFPDTLSWTGSIAESDTLSLNDWRRNNVDLFVEQLYAEIKAAKPSVKFGISPFGIWRPGYPEQIQGYDAYDRIFADSRKWLRSGWVDYFTPQLYWSIEKPEQSYPVLLQWWQEQNVMNRHLWPGNFTSRVIATDGTVWSPAEIVDQIHETRQNTGASGNVHFSMKALLKHPKNMGPELAANSYIEPAVIPPSPWLTNSQPAAPKIDIEMLGRRIVVSIDPGNEAVFRWVVRTRHGSVWTTHVIPGWQQSYVLDGIEPAMPHAVIVNAVDRFGNISADAQIQDVTPALAESQRF